jgi:hypothetical protein
VKEINELNFVPLFFLAPLYAKGQLAYRGIADSLDSGGHPIYVLEKDPQLDLARQVQADVFNIRGTYGGRGGYSIAGHSLGGIKAITAAYHLEAMGCDVNTVRPRCPRRPLPCMSLCFPSSTDKRCGLVLDQLSLIDSPFPSAIIPPDMADDDEIAAELAKYYLEGCVDSSCGLQGWSAGDTKI